MARKGRNDGTNEQLHYEPLLPQFLQGPVVCCSVLQVLYLHGNDGLGEWSTLVSLISGEEVGRKRRIQGVSQQHKLELNLREKGETR